MENLRNNDIGTLLEEHVKYMKEINNNLKSISNDHKLLIKKMNGLDYTVMAIGFILIAISWGIFLNVG